MLKALLPAAAALLLVGCGSTATTAPEPPAEVVEVVEVAAPEPEPLPNYYQESLDLGYEAAVAAGTAKTWSEWDQVADKWIAALQKMRAVPESDANYAQAQAKALEYGDNRSAAFTQRDKLPSESAFKPAAPSDLAARPATPRLSPTARALQAYHAAIIEADPTGAVVTKVEELGTDGAAGLTVTETWQLLPAISRENSAKDLHNMWIGEVVKTGGDRSSAQILIFNRHGKTIAQVHAGGVRLKE